MRSLTAAAVALLLPLTAAAQTTQRFLVPIAFGYYSDGIQGANGSRWLTYLRAFNSTSQDFHGDGALWRLDCVIPEGCFGSPTSGRSAYYDGPPAPNGIVLTVPAPDSSGNVSFHLGVGAYPPRFPIANGTELPVVPEARFTSRTIDFPWVQTDAGRTKLRVYAMDGDSAMVHISVSSQPSFGPEMMQAVADLTLSRRPPQTSSLFPLYADFNFDQLPPNRYSVHITPLPGPADAVPRIWAFITITGNATNDVMIRVPN